MKVDEEMKKRMLTEPSKLGYTPPGKMKRYVSATEAIIKKRREMLGWDSDNDSDDDMDVETEKHHADVMNVEAVKQEHAEVHHTDNKSRKKDASSPLMKPSATTPKKPRLGAPLQLSTIQEEASDNLLLSLLNQHLQQQQQHFSSAAPLTTTSANTQQQTQLQSWKPACLTPWEFQQHAMAHHPVAAVDTKAACNAILAAAMSINVA
jgi:hypothetical protein